MFERSSHAAAFKRPMLKWLLLILTAILIGIVLLSVFRYDRQVDEALWQQETLQGMNQSDPASEPLSNADETILQKQVQEIIAKGTASDCETLSDTRYQAACRDFFKIRK